MAKKITTPGQIHRDHLVNVASNLSQFGKVVTAKDITPVTAQSPVEKSDALALVGAHIIGTGIPHAAVDLLNDITGGNTNVRTTSSKLGLGENFKRVRAIFLKRNPNLEVELK